MDCKSIKKLIHEYLDGDAEFTQISTHLEACSECRAYYEAMLQQKELLSSLTPKNAPSFNLAAAKRRKKARFSRAIGWASAAAAVFVVVLISGSMGLFSGAKSEAPMAAPMAISEGTAEAAAPAEAGYEHFAMDDVMEEAPAAEEEAAPAEKEEAPAAEEAVMEEAPAADAPAEEEAPAAMAEKTETTAPQTTDAPDELHTITLSETQLTSFINTLSKKGISPKTSGDEYVLSITDQNIDLLSEILSQYSDVPLSAGTTIIIRKE